MSHVFPHTTGVVLLPVVLCVFLDGCAAASRPVAATRPADAVATRPAAAAPASSPKPPPLPAKATRKLADLTPPVTRPIGFFKAFKLPVQTEKTVVEAENRIRKRDYAKAVELLERASGFAPDNPRIRRALGVAYAGLGNSGRARDNLERAAGVAPDDLEVQFLLGRFAEAAKKHEDAILAYRTALKCTGAGAASPVSAETLFRLGRLLQQQGYWTAADQCYVQLSGWIERHGRAYRVRKGLRELVFRSEHLLVLRGRLLSHLRRYGEAAELFNRAYRRNRTSSVTAKLLMEALAASKNYRQAEELLVELAAEPAQRPGIPDLAERLCIASSDKAMPGRIWRVLQEKRPGDEALAVGLARTALRLDVPEQAAEILASLLKVRPASVTVGRMLARLRIRQGQPEKALALLGEIVSADAAQTRAVKEALVELASGALAKDFERALAAKARAGKDHALLYVTGQLAAVRGKKFLAADLYRRAIEVKADFLPAYESLMETFLDHKSYDEAERLIERVGRLVEDSVADSFFADYLRGRLALARGDAPAAITALREALAGRRKYLPTLRVLAEAYARAGRNAEAAQTLMQAVGLAGDDEDLYRRLFSVYVAQRQLDRAGAVIKQLRARNPQSRRAQLMMAELLLLRGETENADKLLAELRRKFPDNVEVRMLSLRLAHERYKGKLPAKQLAQAVEYLNEIVRLDPGNARAKRMLAELLGANGRHAEAAEIWGRLYDEASRPLDLGKAYVGALMQAGKHAEAEEVLKELLSGGTKDPSVRRSLLRVLAERKRLDEAEKLVAAWSKQTPEEGMKGAYRMLLLELCEAGKRPGLAEKLASRWLKDTSDERLKAAYRSRLLRLYEAGKHYEKAQKLLDAWLATGPEEALAGALRATKLRMYGQAGQFNEAVRLASQWIQLETKQTDITPKRLLVGVLAEGKQYDRAQALLDEWIAAGRNIKEPGVADNVGLLRRMKIILYGEAGQVDRAVKEAGKMIARSPRELELRRALVAVLIEADEHARAMKIVGGWLARGATTGPATQPTQPAAGPIPAWCREVRVRLLMLQGKNDEAVRLAERYIKGDPKSPELMNLRSSCLGELGRFAEAMASLEKAVVLAAEATARAAGAEKIEKAFAESTLKNNLAYLYAEQGVNMDKGERLIREALSVRPGEVSFQDTLAWVFYKQGRVAEAARVFELVFAQAGERGVGHAVIYDHAGDAQYRLGAKDKAVAYWKQSVELAEKEKFKAREIRELLGATPGKIKAVAAKRSAVVAPLGKGVEPGKKDK